MINNILHYYFKFKNQKYFYNMNEKLVIFKGLYGDNNFDPNLDFIHVEPLESRSKMYNWEIKEHLHTDLAQFFIIERGEGVLFSEKKETIIIGPSVIFIPTNTLHGFNFKDNIQGEVITFSESFLENNFKQNQKIIFELSNLKSFNLNENETFREIDFIKKIIIHEIKDEKIEKSALINILFQALFILVFRLSQSQNKTDVKIENRTLKYFQLFQKQVKNNLLQNKTIAVYAKDFGITSVHLNRICQSVVNKSPIQIVHEHLISEAKKYLLNTSYSISEISYFLNIDDPAYFTRFFKRKVGVSPSDFRKN